MNPYLSITFRSFTIWIMCAVINGMLSGSLLTISGHGADGLVPMILVAGLCSLLFSIPGFFVFWMVMLYLLRKNIMGTELFRAALSTALILAIAQELYPPDYSKVFLTIIPCTCSRCL